VGKNGGATRGDAILGQERVEVVEGMIDALGGLEALEIAAEVGEVLGGFLFELSRYHVLLYVLITNRVFILSELAHRPNGRVRKRKQRGRSHWGRGTCRTVEGRCERG